MTQATAPSLVDRLNDNEIHRVFAEHDFFKRVKADDVAKDNVGVFLGQWWHPLHYFPTFLAQCVATLPDIESKSAITRILNQEAGGGRPAAAHEVIYADSMEKAGFDREAVTGTEPFEETAALVAGYAKAAKEHYSALGFIFATEVTDLLMVSSIGASVERATGQTDNEWVRIHVQQEPDHVEEANNSMLDGFTPEEQDAVLASAEEMWTLWTRFFDRLSAETGVGVPYPAAASGAR